MYTRPHAQGTSFPTPPGTCFTAPAMPMPGGPAHAGREPNLHPFLVIAETETHVQCLMCRTLYSAGENKDKLHQLDRYRRENGLTVIRNPCPPMDPNDQRIQGVVLQPPVLVPKAVLYDMADLRVCCMDGRYDPAPGMDPDEVDHLALLSRSMGTNAAIRPRVISVVPEDKAARARREAPDAGWSASSGLLCIYLPYPEDPSALEREPYAYAPEDADRPEDPSVKALRQAEAARKDRERKAKRKKPAKHGKRPVPSGGKSRNRVRDTPGDDW